MLVWSYRQSDQFRIMAVFIILNHLCCSIWLVSISRSRQITQLENQA